MYFSLPEPIILIKKHKNMSGNNMLCLPNDNKCIKKQIK